MARELGVRLNAMKLQVGANTAIGFIGSGLSNLWLPTAVRGKQVMLQKVPVIIYSEPSRPSVLSAQKSVIVISVSHGVRSLVLDSTLWQRLKKQKQSSI